MFSCPSRRILLSSTSNAPITSRMVSTTTLNNLWPRHQRHIRRNSSSSSSNSKPFGNNNRGLVSKPSGLRRRDRQLAQSTVVAPSISGKVADVAVMSAGKPMIRDELHQQQQQSILPYVARTDHLHHSDVRVSAFFALHRPVSISFPVPGSYTTNSFSKIFESTSVSDIEKYSTQLEAQARQAAGEKRDSALNTKKQNLKQEEILSYVRKDAMFASAADQKAIAESPIQLPGHILSKDFLPFQPPPPPVPISENKATAPVRQDNESVTSWIEIPQELARALVERLQKNNDGLEELRRKSEMQALSVKRQRKLKMKRHKYKKLMKKTRTLRRKLEKQ